MSYPPEPIPAGDYEVRHYNRGPCVTTYTISVGEHKGRHITVPNHLVPDLILTVTVEEEVATTLRNVARFKTFRQPYRDPFGLE